MFVKQKLKIDFIVVYGYKKICYFWKDKNVNFLLLKFKKSAENIYYVDVFVVGCDKINLIYWKDISTNIIKIFAIKLLKFLEKKIEF